MASVYLLNRNPKKNEDFDKKARRWVGTRRIVRNILRDRNTEDKPFRLWVEAKPKNRKIVERPNIEGAIAAFERLGKGLKVGQQLHIDPPKGPELIIRKGVKRIIPILPPQAKENGWTPKWKWLYRRAMIRPGTVFSGDYNCRNIRDGAGNTGGTLSKHSWRRPPGAMDFLFKTLKARAKFIAMVNRKKPGWFRILDYYSWPNCHFEETPWTRGTGEACK